MSHCVVNGCKTSVFNKMPGVSLHSCPRTAEMRSKWLIQLKNKCPMLDWQTSRICSKHFEIRYFDLKRRLKENAIPTLFPTAKVMEAPVLKTKMDRLLGKLSQTQLMNDIKSTSMRLREPLNLSEFLSDDLQTKLDAPLEAKLWLLIKKQEHLNTRLLESIELNKSIANKSREKMEENSSSTRGMDKSIESYKYIIKSLQEKQATMEEQIEILTAVESR